MTQSWAGELSRSRVDHHARKVSPAEPIDPQRDSEDYAVDPPWVDDF